MSTEVHSKLVYTYLQYYKQQCKDLQTSTASLIDDEGEMRLLEEMLDKAELEDAMDGTRDAVVENVSDCLEKCNKATVEVICELLLQVEGMGAKVTIDIHSCDDGDKLEEMKQLGKEGPRAKASAIKGATAADALVSMKINEQTELNERLAKRYQQLQSQHAAAANEQANLLRAIAEAEQNIQKTQSQMVAQGGEARENQEYISSKRHELASLRAQLTEERNVLQAEVLQLQNELSAKVSESKQFNQLKAMLTKKTKSIRELREQIIEAGGSPCVE